MAEAPATIPILLHVPAHLAALPFPEALDRRLHALLDKRDRGEHLTDDEQAEAEALVEVSELLALLRLRMASQGAPAACG